MFQAIYTTGSITGAAETLHVSQPSVSKVVQHAEMQLGFALFSRIKGKLIPTPEADALIVEVNKVYQQINSLKKSARNLLGNASGKISLSVVPALGLDVLPVAIKKFHEQFPDIVFNVHTKHFDDVPSALFEYEMDIGLVFSPVEYAGLSGIEIGSGELVCVHSLGAFHGQKSITINDLAGHEFISIVDSGPLGDVVEREILSLIEPLESRIQVQTYYIAKNLVGYGLGVSVVDEFTARAEGPGSCEATPFEPPITFNIQGFYLESRPLSMVCREFLECFREVFENQINRSAP